MAIRAAVISLPVGIVTGGIVDIAVVTMTHHPAHYLGGVRTPPPTPHTHSTLLDGANPDCRHW